MVRIKKNGKKNYLNIYQKKNTHNIYWQMKERTVFLLLLWNVWESE